MISEFQKTADLIESRAEAAVETRADRVRHLAHSLKAEYRRGLARGQEIAEQMKIACEDNDAFNDDMAAGAEEVRDAIGNEIEKVDGPVPADPRQRDLMDLPAHARV